MFKFIVLLLCVNISFSMEDYVSIEVYVKKGTITSLKGWNKFLKNIPEKNLFKKVSKMKLKHFTKSLIFYRATILQADYTYLQKDLKESEIKKAFGKTFGYYERLNILLPSTHLSSIYLPKLGKKCEIICKAGVKSSCWKVRDDKGNVIDCKCKGGN